MCWRALPQPFLPEDLSRRLLSQARDQQAEIEAEENGGGAAAQPAARRGFGHAVAAQRKAIRQSGRRAGADSESDDDDAGSGGGLPRRFRAGGSGGGDDDDDDGLDDAVRQVEARTDMEEAVAGITEEDERALELFRSSKPVQAKRTLADIIAEKMKEKEAEIATAASGAPAPCRGQGACWALVLTYHASERRHGAIRAQSCRRGQRRPSTRKWWPSIERTAGSRTLAVVS